MQTGQRLCWRVLVGKPGYRAGTSLGVAALLGFISLVWVCLLVFPHLQGRANLIDPVESRLLDLRYQIVGPRKAAPDIMFVAIDDATLDAGQTGPVGRARLARLIHHIADSEARVLVLDVLLADAGPVSERVTLAAALSRLPTVIAAAARFDDTGVANVIWPHEAFASQAEVGLVNLSTDAAGTPRYVPLFLDVSGQPLPSMPLLAAVTYTGAQARIDESALTLDQTRVPLDGGANMPLRALGPTGTVPTISARDLLDSPLPAELSGKLVVLGFSAAAMGDRFVTPFDDDTPGAEIIATAISQLVSGEALRHDGQTRTLDAIHAAILTVLCLALMLGLPLLKAISLSVLVIVVSFAAVTVVFAQGVWLSAALPLIAALPPLAVFAGFRLFVDRFEARKSVQSLAAMRRFQSPALARRIELDPDYLMSPETQKLVIFFVDLTGFTSLSQQLGQNGTRALLQRFHSLTAEAIEPRGGSVINFMGDGALAVFGLEPEKALGTDADAALAAAHALDQSLSRERPLSDSAPLTCRIGLHSGAAVLSRLGADSHQQVTVSGDTVNLASRLMEVAKSEQARIVATLRFVEQLSSERYLEDTRQTDVAIRGRSGDVAVVSWPIR